ncbi:MAG: hypothetical protein J2P39_14950 [Candidatus Dormibacteraeota bacterium]|nr:hypothetical protein [Candidatus Dormibacteraeota bacterium]
MDDSSTLDRLLQDIDAADEAMREQAAKGTPTTDAEAWAQPNGNGPVEDLLSLVDQLIELLELKEVLLAEQPDVWSSPRTAREDPRVLGLQLDRLRERRDFWEGMRAPRSGPAFR